MKCREVTLGLVGDGLLVVAAGERSCARGRRRRETVLLRKTFPFCVARKKKNDFFFFTRFLERANPAGSYPAT